MSESESKELSESQALSEPEMVMAKELADLAAVELAYNEANAKKFAGKVNGDIIHVKKDGKYGTVKVIKSEAWGEMIVPAEDPRAIDLPSTDYQGFRLKRNFPKLPREKWARIIALYFDYCDPNNTQVDATTEVSVVLLRKKDDNYQTWRVLVPEQEVGGAIVEANFRNKLCDIETGEEVTQFPPDGWDHVGSSHSHNTMGAFFSSVDDANELSVPGMHIVVGKIDRKKMTYEVATSIVLRKQRREGLELEEVVDCTPTELEYHPNVKKYISKIKSRTFTHTSVKDDFRGGNWRKGYRSDKIGFADRTEVSHPYVGGEIFDADDYIDMYSSTSDKKSDKSDKKSGRGWLDFLSKDSKSDKEKNEKIIASYSNEQKLSAIKGIMTDLMAKPDCFSELHALMIGFGYGNADPVDAEMESAKAKDEKPQLEETGLAMLREKAVANPQDVSQSQSVSQDTQTITIEAEMIAELDAELEKAAKDEAARMTDAEGGCG